MEAYRRTRLPGTIDPNLMGIITPLNISVGNLVGWWDFSDIATLYKDNGKVNPVTADDDLIGYVEDKSGSDNHAVIANAKRPTYKTNIQDGKSAGYTDGSNQLGLMTPALNINKYYTIFVVAKDAGIAGYPRGMINADDFASTKRVFQFRKESSVSVGSIVFADGDRPDDTMSISAQSVAICTLTRNSNSAEVFINGSSNGASSGDDGVNLSPRVVLFNAITQPGDSYQALWHGHIFEVVFYAGAILSSAEIEKVENYLNVKWSVY